GGGGSDTGPAGDGGGGGYAYAVISVTPGETLDIVIGGGGSGGVVTGSGNGGDGGGGGTPVAGGGAGAGSSTTVGGGGGGAGYAAVLRGATFLVIGAGGGGGGGGGNAGGDFGGDGGAGGGTNGVAGSPSTDAGGGGGGTQSGGGAGGSSGNGGNGVAGGLNVGGDGGNNGGGGGGSGNYGGGGGGGDDDGAGGGGGGSGTGDILVAGSGRNAGNNSDPDYAGSAGQGGLAGTSGGNGGGGNPGRIVLTYDVPYFTSDVTYNGVGLMQLINYSEAGDNAHVEMWYLVAPATGTNSVVITHSGANDVVGGATSWTGVDQSTPFGPTATADGTASPATVDVTSASNEVVLDVVAVRNAATMTVGAGQTQRWNLGVGVMDGGGSSEAGAATVAMSWTLTGTFEWAIGGASLRPVAGPSCDSITVTTSDPAGQLWFNETVEPDGLPLTTQLNVSASSQSGATPALSVTNDGSATCDVTIRLQSDPGIGRSLKFNTTNSAPWPSDAAREVPINPSSVTVCSSVAPSGTCDIWLWADYENAWGGQTLADVRVETV
ncbi:MAG: hypothetical protein ACE5I4_00345, partial [Thermoplasmata archaeon]